MRRWPFAIASCHASGGGTARGSGAVGAGGGGAAGGETGVVAGGWAAGGATGGTHSGGRWCGHHDGCGHLLDDGATALDDTDLTFGFGDFQFRDI